jgi:Rieske Fe-S protein
VAGRRDLLNAFLGTSIGGMLAAVAYPILRYVVPPDAPESQTARTVAAAEGELRVGDAKVFQFGSRAGILVRAPDGGYRAFSATCTHLSCTVQYRPDFRQLWCACHNGFYDLNGRNVSGPPPQPLEEYQVRVANGEVVVSRG